MYRLSSRRGSVRIAVYGVLVGLGMVAVTVAVFSRLPIGKELIQALRQDSSGPSESRVEPESGDIGQDRPSDAVDSKPSDLTDKEIPGQIMISRSVEVTIGMSRLSFEEGEMMTVSGRENGMFLCDYLGDTVKIPIDATDWGEAHQLAP